MILFSTMQSQTPEAENLIDQWANDTDREHAARRKKPGAAQNSLLVRALVRRLLEDKDVEILSAENGKPYLQNGPHISVSHSHEMAAAAICPETAIGVDIEYWRERDFKKLAAYTFGPNEREMVEKGGVLEFYRIWTMREAIAKIGGESIFRGIDGKDVDIGKWWIFNDLAYKNYSLSLATAGLACEIRKI